MVPKSTKNIEPTSKIIKTNSTSIIIDNFEVNENEVIVTMENAAAELKKFGNCTSSKESELKM